LANISRHDYLPFGEELTAGYGGRTSGHGYTGDCVRDKFVGYERDAETGLDYAEARYHGAVYGRFTSVDPALGSARKSLPQSWNRYTYVMNQPLSLIDPTGEWWIYKSGAGGELRFMGKGSPSPQEKNKWEGDGYEVWEDNTFHSFGVGGKGLGAQFNGETIRVNADGTYDFIRAIISDKVGGALVGLYAMSATIALGATGEITLLTAAELALLQAQILGMGEEEAEGGAVLQIESIELDPKVGRSGAFRQAKRDAGIPISQQPESINRVPMTDMNGKAILGDDGKPIMTREYTFVREDGSKVIIQDHSAGHKKGGEGPHFNVRPPENTRTGKVPGTNPHYKFRIRS
jgi:RHS repeat-associated protein